MPKTDLSTAILAGAAVFALSLGACSRAGDTPEKASEAAAPAAAATPAMPQTPFSAAEARMNEAMMAATGADASQAWTRKMIAHHQRAVDMSRVVLQTTQDADIRRMAQMTVEMQTEDLADLRRWLAQHGGDAPPAAGAGNPFTAVEKTMHDAMMGATGEDVSVTWARKMIPHHQGAVDMSRMVLQTTQDADIRRMAQKTIDLQTKDIADLQRWLEQYGSATPSS